MYLIYIDESETTHSFKKDPKPYSLSACIVNERDWNRIDKEVIKLKKNFFLNLNPDDIELHAKHIFRKSKFFKKELKDKNYDLLDDCYKLIQTLPISIISVIIDKEKLKKNQEENDYKIKYTCFDLCWHYLLERLCIYLEKRNNECLSNEDEIQFGLLFIDEQASEKKNRKLRNKVLDYLRGKKYIKIGKKFFPNIYLIKEMHFLDSQFYNLAQITDLIAYSVNRKYFSKNNNSQIDQHNEKYYQMVIKKFDKDDNGNVEGYGLKIYP